MAASGRSGEPLASSGEASAGAQTGVEIFLGSPLEVRSEEQFLARLRRDLSDRSLSARILANLHVGSRGRQLDFVVIAAERTVFVELKTFPGPLVAAPMNGDWTVRTGTSVIALHGNPGQQARETTFAFSDELRAFAKAERLPYPRGGFYRDIDTVVCVYPTVPAGSVEPVMPDITLLGYQELLDRLQQPGRHIMWPPEIWDAFGRRLHLYRASDHPAVDDARRESTTIVDAYRGFFHSAKGHQPQLVETAVRVNGTSAPRPDLADELADGRAVLLRGGSGFGKTLWAAEASVQLARNGHVPVWLTAETCELSIRASLARAVSPYTANRPGELLQAARTAGRTVVFIVDDVAKASDRIREATLDGLRAMRLRHPGCGVLLTAQAIELTTVFPDLLDVELEAPEEDERTQLLELFGAPEIRDLCDAFVSPLELLLAAESAPALETGASVADLIDMHVDRVVDGNESLRRGLRVAAGLMHSTVSPWLRRPDLARTLGRDHLFDDERLNQLWACPLLTIAHGRVSFRHERFERFLAAEHLLLERTTPEALARTLASPRVAGLLGDAISLEHDEHRLQTMLKTCQDSALLVEAARGRLGQRAADVVRTLLTITLSLARRETSTATGTFDPGDAIAFSGRWSLDRASGLSHALLAAAGTLAVDGLFLDELSELVDETDALCNRTLAESASTIATLPDRVFAATYALSGDDTLAATTVVNAAIHEAMFSRVRGNQRPAHAARLLNGVDGLGSGRLYLVAHLLRRQSNVDPPLVDVILRCLKSDLYHVQLLGLEMSEDLARLLKGTDRQRIVDAVAAMPTNFLGTSSGVAEALSALGALDPAHDLDDLTERIHEILTRPEDQIHRQLAYSAVACQFESDVVGPYYEAIGLLSDRDRHSLCVMALHGGETDGIAMGWLLEQFDEVSDPETRSALLAYVARADPKKWISVQRGMASFVRSVHLLTAAGIELPEPISDSIEPAWQASVALIRSAMVAGDGKAAMNDAWGTLLATHPNAIASLLFNLWSARALERRPSEVHDRILTVMPDSGLEALAMAVERPGSLQSLVRWERGVREHAVELLARVGDRSVTGVLRRHADDPVVGRAAAAAVRSIEARALR